MNQIYEELVFKMTQISIKKSSVDKAAKEINNKIGGIHSIKAPATMESIAKAGFTITTKRFIKETNILAATSQKRFHHIYEWGKVGQDNSRLFVITRDAVRGGNLRVSSKFIDSKSKVPVSKSLDGKKYRSSHVFKKKATVMESGRPVTIVPRRGKMLVFPGKDGKMVFTKKSFVQHPGGKPTKGSFDSHMRKWFSNPANMSNALSSSGFMKDLENNISKALNKNGGGAKEVNTAIKSVSIKYSEGKVKL